MQVVITIPDEEVDNHTATYTHEFIADLVDVMENHWHASYYEVVT